jgi:16S rRNA (uracil1498-N3)-methyltransferase
LEKATELGVSEIFPLLTERTERPRIKQERANKIVLAASKQSQRAYLPIVHPIIEFSNFLESQNQEGLIAHCISEKSRVRISSVRGDHTNLVLIGPEGDFTQEEVEKAEERGFLGVKLTEHRLRTETAGIFAVAALQISNA